MFGGHSTDHNKQLSQTGTAAQQQPRDDQQWIPILDYAVLKGISTSTLRRYIKANKIQYKIENGRYLLLADDKLAGLYDRQRDSVNHQAVHGWDGASPQPHGGAANLSSRTRAAALDASAEARVHELEERLLHAQEQISELKMLIAIYEEKLAQLDC